MGPSQMFLVRLMSSLAYDLAIRFPGPMSSGTWVCFSRPALSVLRFTRRAWSGFSGPERGLSMLAIH